ncbi:MAG TPA: hypothetical protein VKT82_26175 [Ktedonobacterales bacterium]|nr:hypothetical protein [Ktedonobacterales bacterium]
MLQSQLNPRDQELLELGLFAINQAHNEGKINLKEWQRLSAEWARRVLDDDEDVEGCYSSECLDS